jgi:dipeptidyl-peptidase-4
MLQPPAAFLDALAVATRPVPGMAIPSNLSFSPDDTCLAYLDTTAEWGESRQLFIMDLKALSPRAVLRPAAGGDTEEEFSLEERLRRERQRLQTTGVTQFAWSRDAEEGSKLVLPMQGQWLAVSPWKEPAAPRVLVEKDASSGPALDASASPNGELLAFVRQGDLFLAPAKAPGPPLRLTFDAEDGVTNGLASFLAQEEMDRALLAGVRAARRDGLTLGQARTGTGGRPTRG